MKVRIGISGLMQQLKDLLKKHWGYDSFRPLQEEAMRAVMAQRDSVVVLPTGGGKSLCFQIPAMALPGLAVVVSPLISLMKDQVDALIGCGVSAAFINSTQTPDERRLTIERMRCGELKLLYVAPERLTADGFLDLLKKCAVSFFAVDEAHCISMWGHDFRKDYRELKILKMTFPNIAVHGYTATATQQVRLDIARQLSLRDPTVLVGSFDRPNLIYRVEARSRGGWDQIRAVIKRHRSESGIIYCISRKKVDDLSAALVQSGYRALPYHAGMEDADRKKNQEAFLHEKVEIIVATVAFGMGIDKSNVRFVLHAGVPKSIEHYQQESGRAGRDGLEAECVLLFSLGDLSVWRKLLKDMPAEAHAIAMKKLTQMGDYCTGVTCRHRALVNYFGQEFAKSSCGACDTCLDETHSLPDSAPSSLPDALITAQKILSCVVRLEQQCSAEYTALVLIGADDPRIRERGHDKLKTLGALSAATLKDVCEWIGQLVAQECLVQSGEFRMLKVTPKGWRVIRGEEKPLLPLPGVPPARKSRVEVESWGGVDRELFEKLRTVRRQIADAKEVPAFVVLSDATLRELARLRPSTWAGLLDVPGIGERKRADYGKRFLERINAHCRAGSLAMDVRPQRRSGVPLRRTGIPPVSREDATLLAFELFDHGGSINDVAAAIGRSPDRTSIYLSKYLESRHASAPNPWIDAAIFARVRYAAARVGTAQLKPIYDLLGGTVNYGLIRIGLACLRNQMEAAADRSNSRVR